MKTILTMCLAIGLLSGAEKKPKNSKPAANAALASPTAIPAGAVPTEDGSFRYTDAQGKKWLYRNTPFGVSKVEDKPVDQSQPVAVDELTKAVESGDVVRFERPGPFGATRWEKKKSELDASEQSVLDRQKQKSSK